MNENTIRRYLVLLNLPHRFTEAQLKQSYRDISRPRRPVSDHRRVAGMRSANWAADSQGMDRRAQTDGSA